MKRKHILLMALMTMIIGAGCKVVPYQPGTKHYTTYNLWYEHPTKMRSLNYHKGTIIPAGTPILNISTMLNRVSFLDDNTSKKHRIIFESKYFRSLTSTTFCDRVFSSEKIDEKLNKLSPLEQECIKEGVIKPGMTKDAVLISYGYPPEHRTPSLDDATWIYWKDRFRQTVVTFDAKGIVTSVK